MNEKIPWNESPKLGFLQFINVCTTNVVRRLLRRGETIKADFHND